MNLKLSSLFLLLALSLALALLSCKDDKDDPQPEIISASGDIQAAMDEFRNLLGPNNGNTAGSQSTGRREINWDGISDDDATPNGYLGDFFNDPIFGQTRGIEFTTPGMGLIVSADSNNPTGTPMSFGNINPQYTTIFPPFSGERIFSPLGSNIADIYFFVPGTNTPAVVRGFGAVYIDVDREENAAFEFFDIYDRSLGVYGTPALNEGHVFLAALYPQPIIHHVRIEYGNSALGPEDGVNIDVSVMDDFIFGEPQEAE